MRMSRISVDPFLSAVASDSASQTDQDNRHSQTYPDMNRTNWLDALGSKIPFDDTPSNPR